MIDVLVSGFGYCTPIGHKDVRIYKNAQGKYYVQISAFSSETFDDLSDIEMLWKRVREAEKDFLSVYNFNDRTNDRPGIGSRICPEPLAR
jgi:CRISPR/Cas system-associated endoribonuclease Cas2